MRDGYRRTLDELDRSLARRQHGTTTTQTAPVIDEASLLAYDIRIRQAHEQGGDLFAAGRPVPGQALCLWIGACDPADPVLPWVLDQVDQHLMEQQLVLTTEGYQPVGALMQDKRTPVQVVGKTDHGYRLAAKAMTTTHGWRLHPNHPVWASAPPAGGTP